VLDTGDATSVLEHVVLDGLSVPRAPELTLTGAATFYEAPVEIRESRFVAARAEDQLNVIRACFGIARSLFEAGQSDALDSDFSKGDISETEFVAPTNDGIDVSGSVVSVRDVRVRGAGDKAISAGEGSRLHGEDVAIEASNVGIASKDTSEVQLRRVRIADTRIGLAAFQKKSEFGPATLAVRELTLERVAEPHWVEEGSTVYADRETIAGTRTNPRPIFYPNE
jgi:hypothetical protein